MFFFVICCRYFFFNSLRCIHLVEHKPMRISSKSLRLPLSFSLCVLFFFFFSVCWLGCLCRLPYLYRNTCLSSVTLLYKLFQSVIRYNNKYQWNKSKKYKQTDTYTHVHTHTNFQNGDNNDVMVKQNHSDCFGEKNWIAEKMFNPSCACTIMYNKI